MEKRFIACKASALVLPSDASNYDFFILYDCQRFAVPFLCVTQPEAFKKLAMADDTKDINRLKFLARISSEISKRGVIDVAPQASNQSVDVWRDERHVRS